jgi:hypothetical protein
MYLSMDIQYISFGYIRHKAPNAKIAQNREILQQNANFLAFCEAKVFKW